MNTKNTDQVALNALSETIIDIIGMTEAVTKRG
jgi:hypothetical protein